MLPKHLQFEFLQDMINCPLELKNFYHAVPVALEEDDYAKAEFEIRKATLMENPEVTKFLDELTQKYELKNPEKLNFIKKWIDENFADDETGVWTEKINEYNAAVGLMLPVRIFIDCNFPSKFLSKLDDKEKEIVDFLLLEGDIDKAKTYFNNFELFEKKLIESAGVDNFNQALYLAFVLKSTAKENEDYWAHLLGYRCYLIYEKLRDYQPKTEDKRRHVENIKFGATELLQSKMLVDEDLEDNIKERRLLLNLCLSVETKIKEKTINYNEFQLCNESLNFFRKYLPC